VNFLAILPRVSPTFLQASLNITKKRCGNPRCRCAQEGPLHGVTSLTWKEENRTRKGKTLYDHPVLEAKLVHQSSELRRGLLFPSPGLSPSPQPQADTPPAHHPMTPHCWSMMMRIDVSCRGAIE
jgi:hypothetical protein